MSISSMMRHVCNTNRAQLIGTNGRKSMTQNLTAQRCLVMPMADHVAIENKYTVGQAWTIYFPTGTDILMGDRIIYNSENFLVQGVKNFVNFDGMSYMSVMAVTEFANG